MNLISMNNKILIDIPKDFPDKDVPLFALLVKLSVEGRTWTGYKEIQAYGVELDDFLAVTGSKVNKRGAINVNFSKVKHLIINSDNPSKERYVLDTDIFEYEYDIIQAFKDRDPVWFTPYKDFCQYDEDMFSELPEQLQQWFLRKLKKGVVNSPQALLENTYKKYVIDGNPLPYQTNKEKD